MLDLMKKTNWENGTLISKAKVMIDGVTHEVEPEEYEGKTPMSADFLNEMENNINKALNAVLELSHPVGSTYVTQDNTNPNTILGFGTWERFKGLIALGLDENDADFNEIGKTGGEKEHTLTKEEMPTHRHYFFSPVWEQKEGYGNINGEPSAGANRANITGNTNDTGGGQPHNNTQPYEVVGYMWIRRA